MQRVSTVSLIHETVAEASTAASQIVWALRASQVTLELAANYEALLTEFVFSHPAPEVDGKDIKQYQRILRASDSYQFLCIIWKESDFVTDEVRASAGLERSFKKENLTSHSLAVALAETPASLAALNSRIRSIGLAAERFGLVVRSTRRTSKVVLAGTERLHRFMMLLSERNISTISQIMGDGLRRAVVGPEHEVVRRHA